MRALFEVRTERKPMPYHKLVAWQVAMEFLLTLKDAQLSDAVLRAQALKAAKSVVLNIAEANGRESAADKKRVFAIARGELSEACVAVYVALAMGECSVEQAARAQELASRAHALLTGLINR